MQAKLVPYNKIEDFTEIADNLKDSLVRKDNTDIADEFPNTFKAHTDDIPVVITNLEKSRNLCDIGKHEQFIVFCGHRAVGLCVVTCELDVPKGVRPSTPNLSGFIVNPYRAIGLGRFSIEERMKVVEENFHNRAWTVVQDGNLPSEHLVTSVGFRKSDKVFEGRVGHSLYLFGDAES